MNKDIIFLRAVEVAAIASYKYIGRKDKNKLDSAAVEAMKIILDNENGFSVKIVNGEGELDEAPMLYAGQVLGKSTNLIFDMSVDPIEGTAPAANNIAGSISCLAISNQNTQFQLPEMYMEKLFISQKFKDKVIFNGNILETIKEMQDIKSNTNLKCIILNKDRHQKIIKELDKLGIIIRLIEDGDVLAAIDVVNGEADFVYGIGGAPEGVLMASLAISSGSEMFSRLVPYKEIWPDEKEAKKRNEIETSFLKEKKIDVQKIYKSTDLISDKRTRFFASGVTAGGTLKPIDYIEGKFYINSFFSSHGVVRNITSIYDVENVNEVSKSIKFIFDKYKR